MGYAEDLKIDRNDLVGDWEEQATLMMHYCDLYAIAVFERDTEKVRLEYIAAQLDSDVRKNFKNYGFASKPTEAAIKNTVVMQKKYRRAVKKALLTAKQANLMAGVRTSFEHRKKALENMVTLLVTGFHSEPKNKPKNIQKMLTSKHHNHNKKILKGGKRNHLLKRNQKA